MTSQSLMPFGKEIWKDIPCWEGFYQVSTLGNIKNSKGSILKSGKNKKGYMMVALYKNSKGHTRTVHRLVAQAFISNPNNLPHINHIDSNRINNHITNLEWCNHSMNMKHGYKYGKVKPPRTDKKIIQFNMDGSLIATYESIKIASEKTCSDRSHISKVCKGKLNSTNNYRWAYA